MNILYINHYAGSPDMGMEFRPYYLAREWVKMGYKVTIIAADFSHLRSINPKIETDFEVEYIDGIKYSWVHTTTYKNNGIKRATTMAQFVGKLWKNAKRIANKVNPDVIITSSTYPIDTFVGQRIKHFCKNGTILIHEIHDMWPITPIEINHMSKWHPFIMLMQMGENSFCKNSDIVVSLLPNAKNYLIEHGMKPDHFFHVPNGVVLEEWDNPLPLPDTLMEQINELHEQSSFILCFFGSHTKSYALDYLVDAVRQIPKEKIGVLFVGGGNYKSALKEKAKKFCNIKFHDSIPKECIPSLMDSIDAVYIGALKNDMFRFGICMNKLFDSMMGGKPILYAVEAPNNYINDYKCGISVEAENADALKNGIVKMLGLSPEERAELGDNGRKAAKNIFNYKYLAKNFSDVFYKASK